ncbi:MAG: class I SAM-dependent methyltransferase [Betaproteobacteria bacterium]|jgi:ubiquinone/menaquinone biosynthesis C-methylase UbiE|nr:class I SAM-dependent methyltransferase [Rhodocyclaceae bacterium]MCA3133211.1 class I SAM-dependent methyltransferase [Rhodocyclaceae bacterium]MCA3140622.1 class I SAM-dependent methyltransferase [Rhodocyclaceae bacterium]MCA3144209.1 class I SAM-dependent methyltransferase [Rhodocyclaceae bacterium]MCE2897874.1 class I SAM-dependent methyltransferase [Betaproteobacteria bacterium]
MLRSAQDWDTKWDAIFDSYQKDIRHAHYINAVRRKNENKILEIAAGSFRDVAALNRWGIDCAGFDFSESAVHQARARFPGLEDKLSCRDAFDTGFHDKSFDLTYHNGFWVLFKDDGDVQRLLSEQIRLTRRRVVATVHNGHNRQFVDYFRRRVDAGEDLFEVRFFRCNEIMEIMSSRCRNVAVIPVGKAYRAHEDWLIRAGLGNRAVLRSYFGIAGQMFLSSSERLLCIGDVRD